MSPISRFRSDPSRDRSLRDYRKLARRYDGTVNRIHCIRDEAIASLQLRAGEAVLDVGCGTGESLIQLAGAVGPNGHVVGVEQSPEMAGRASERLAQKGLAAQVELIVSSLEQFDHARRFDAMLLSFTQDVLQSPLAIDALVRHARPGARIAVAGMCFVPWWWGAPINAFNAWRARHYMSTFRGLRRPWQGLEPHCPDLVVAQRYLLGSCYRAVGTFVPASAHEQATGSV